MVKIDALFQTKTGNKKIFWRNAYLYSLYKGLRPRAKKNALQIMSLAAYASEAKYTLNMLQEKIMSSHKRNYIYNFIE